MNKLVKILVIGFMTLSTVLWSAGSALAVSGFADYTNTGAATDTFGRNDTNRLVMNILLNNDVLVHNGVNASVAGDALIAFGGTEKFIDVDNSGIYKDADPIIVSVDNTLTVGLLNGAGDTVITKKDAVSAFGDSSYIFDTTVDATYTDGEAVINNVSANGQLANGDTVITAGKANVKAFIAGDNVYWCDNGNDANYAVGEVIWKDANASGAVYEAGTDYVLVGAAAPVEGVTCTEKKLPQALSGLAYLNDNVAGYTSTKDTSGDSIVWFGNGVSPADAADLTTAVTFLSPAQLAADDINGIWLATKAIKLNGIATAVGYMDANHNAAYTDGEAIVQNTGAGTLAELAATDTVLHAGAADINGFPASDVHTTAGAYVNGQDIYRENGIGNNFIDRLELNAITVQNAGTAIFNDITAVHVWLDADANGTFSAALDTDLDAAGMVADNINGWTLSGLTTNISGANSRLFVTVNIYSGADDNRTIQMRIPVLVDTGITLGEFDAGEEGIFFDGADTTGDGPNDAVILSANTQTIDVPSSPASDTTPPDAPTGVSAQGTGIAGEIKLTWTNPTASDFSGVRIFRSQTSGNVATNGAIVVISTTETSYTDTNLTNGSTYYYVLMSMDNAGNYTNSSEVSAVAGSQPSTTATTTATIATTTTTTTTTPSVVTVIPSIPTLTPVPYASPKTTAEMQANLNVLLQNLAVLQAAVATAQPATGTGVTKPASGSYSKPLPFGSTSADVTALQNFLKVQGTDIYPEGKVTGYFGTLTKKAVQKFQEKYGIANPGDPGYGTVGPKTRAKINSLLGL